LALGPSEQVIAVAERLGKALLGKSAMPYDHPLCTGSLGLLGTKASWDLMQACVTLLIGGSDTEFLPESAKARGVPIDHKAGMLGLR
jgi:pyruvate dehydrogenase (quinone)